MSDRGEKAHLVNLQANVTYRTCKNRTEGKHHEKQTLAPTHVIKTFVQINIDISSDGYARRMTYRKIIIIN